MYEACARAVRSALRPPPIAAAAPSESPPTTPRRRMLGPGLLQLRLDSDSSFSVLLLALAAVVLPPSLPLASALQGAGATTIFVDHAHAGGPEVSAEDGVVVVGGLADAAEQIAETLQEQGSTNIIVELAPGAHRVPSSGLRLGPSHSPTDPRHTVVWRAQNGARTSVTGAPPRQPRLRIALAVAAAPAECTVMLCSQGVCRSLAGSPQLTRRSQRA